MTIDTFVGTAEENILGVDVEKSTAVDTIITHKQKITNKGISHEQVPVIRNNLSSQSLPIPVRPEMLNNYLEGYSKDQRDYLLDGFSKGFRLRFSGTREAQDSHNLKSAIDHHNVAAGRIAGPLSVSVHHNLKISPLDVVPKRQEGQFRLIHHLSYPRASVYR